MLISTELLDNLTAQAKASPRLRQNFDLRDTPEDGSQRMLNALEVGTKVPIHRHEETSETVVCLQGRLDVIFYADLPNMDAGRPGREFQETFFVLRRDNMVCRYRREHGIQ